MFRLSYGTSFLVRVDTSYLRTCTNLTFRFAAFRGLYVLGRCSTLPFVVCINYIEGRLGGDTLE